MKKLLLSAILVGALSACNSAEKAAKDFEDSIFDRKDEKRIEVANDLISDNEYINVEGRIYYVGDDIDIGRMDRGMHERSFEIGRNRYFDRRIKSEGELRIYKQKNSVIIGMRTEREYDGDGDYRNVNKFTIKSVQGDETKFDKLPKSGTYTYTGKAFDKNNESALRYYINFNNKTGEGKISNLSGSDEITLQSAPIQHSAFDRSAPGIEGVATSAKIEQGNYKLGIYGPDGEEIGGKVTFIKNGDSQEIGFGGRR